MDPICNIGIEEHFIWYPRFGYPGPQYLRDGYTFLPYSPLLFISIGGWDLSTVTTGRGEKKDWKVTESNVASYLPLGGI